MTEGVQKNGGFKEQKKFRYIDLFAGLGGFHLAMDKLGGECVFASEIQEDLRELYKKNYGIEKVNFSTVRKYPNFLGSNFLCY